MLHGYYQCFRFEVVATGHPEIGDRYVISWKEHLTEDADGVWTQVERRVTLTARDKVVALLQHLLPSLTKTE